MTAIRVVAIPTEVANSVRETMRAPGYGFPAHAELAGIRDVQTNERLESVPVREDAKGLFVGPDFVLVKDIRRDQSISRGIGLPSVEQIVVDRERSRFFGGETFVRARGRQSEGQEQN